jgi:hypothetical protein
MESFALCGMYNCTHALLALRCRSILIVGHSMRRSMPHPPPCGPFLGAQPGREGRGREGAAGTETETATRGAGQAHQRGSGAIPQHVGCQSFPLFMCMVEGVVGCQPTAAALIEHGACRLGAALLVQWFCDRAELGQGCPHRLYQPLPCDSWLAGREKD